MVKFGVLHVSRYIRNYYKIEEILALINIYYYIP